MRRALDRLYDLSGALAAAFLVAIAGIVLAQVMCNVVDWLAERLAGGPIGLLIPSYADFAGYFLVAATFFALAHSFRKGALIRVNLLLLRLPQAWRRAAELLCSGLAALIAAYLGWYVGLLTYDAWRFGDLSSGLVPIPLWIPRAGMTAGIAALLVACLDSFVEAALGRTPGHAAGEGGSLE